MTVLAAGDLGRTGTEHGSFLYAPSRLVNRLSLGLYEGYDLAPTSGVTHPRPGYSAVPYLAGLRPGTSREAS